MTAQSLVARINSEAAKAADEAAKKAAGMQTIAAAWDAAGFTGLQPWFIHPSALYGAIGMLSFKDAGIDDLAALMRAFPAIECDSYSHNRTGYFHPVGERIIPEGVTPRRCDGYELRFSASQYRGGGGHGESGADWNARLGDVVIRFSVKLRGVHWLYPRPHRHAVERNGEFLRFEGASSLVWPGAGFNEQRWHDAQAEFGLFLKSYYMGDESLGDWRVRGSDVAGLVAAMEALANEREAETVAAFNAAYAHVGPVPSHDDIAKRAEAIRANYDADVGGLRAGTLMQTAALDTEHAKADKGVAHEHWPRYAAHHGIETRQSYFDHFAWSRAYLKRVGLYEVPVTDEMRASAKGGITGDVYTYGARWL